MVTLFQLSHLSMASAMPAFMMVAFGTVRSQTTLALTVSLSLCT
jgi:hypothetical protein